MEGRVGGRQGGREGGKKGKRVRDRKRVRAPGTFSGSAPGRSILLMTGIIVKLDSNARYTLARV